MALEDWLTGWERHISNQLLFNAFKEIWIDWAIYKNAKGVQTIARVQLTSTWVPLSQETLNRNTILQYHTRGLSHTTGRSSSRPSMLADCRYSTMAQGWTSNTQFHTTTFCLSTVSVQTTNAPSPIHIISHYAKVTVPTRWNRQCSRCCNLHVLLLYDV